MLSARGKHIDAHDTRIITAAAQLGTFEHIEVLIPAEAMALRLLLLQVLCAFVVQFRSSRTSRPFRPERTARVNACPFLRLVIVSSCVTTKIMCNDKNWLSSLLNKAHIIQHPISQVARRYCHLERWASPETAAFAYMEEARGAVVRRRWR